jgi:hypothetical protein
LASREKCLPLILVIFAACSGNPEAGTSGDQEYGRVFPVGEQVTSENFTGGIIEIDVILLHYGSTLE